MNAFQRVASSAIRAQFAVALSDMYRNEVPMYGALVDMVEHINQQELDKNPRLRQALADSNALQRLSAERHGAIRLGKAEELHTMRRLFAVMGMVPVGYYDLTEAGIPVHSTAFRPLELDQLNASPFRIFTSLLRLDIVEDEDLRRQARAILDARNIFTDEVMQLIEVHERQQGLTGQQADRFINAALETFRWHRQATVDLKTYQQFLSTHRLLADIVCFKGPHINHLTPRTLNIDQAQQSMADYGLDPKAIIEGPPGRACPILLRQTSFKALKEKIAFIDKKSGHRSGSHTARFGEIEQRGMALTPKGRALYDTLLNEVRLAVPDAVQNTTRYYQQLESSFKHFPDEIGAIRMQRLAYFSYTPAGNIPKNMPTELETLIDRSIIKVNPLTYEDFLPVSAAGIFHSNLDQHQTQQFTRSPNQQAFEHDLGCAVINEFEHYAAIQSASLRLCLQKLGMDTALQQKIIDEVAR